MLLRTHTSPVQVRTMLSQKPPDPRGLSGPHLSHRFRRDAYAAVPPGRGPRHRQGSHLGHLKWILHEFCKAFFEVDHINMRFRPSFFPFTEPSLEVDIQCRRDKGEIRFGEGEDWLEILGCGMVHPNVLRACGIDPDVYQGFAWGMGIDRIAMLKYGMPICGSCSTATSAGSTITASSRSTCRRWRGIEHVKLAKTAVAERAPTLPSQRERSSSRPASGRGTREAIIMKFTLSWLKEHLDTDEPLESSPTSSP
jgi:hypothetical protein